MALRLSLAGLRLISRAAVVPRPAASVRCLVHLAPSRPWIGPPPPAPAYLFRRRAPLSAARKAAGDDGGDGDEEEAKGDKVKKPPTVLPAKLPAGA